MDELKWIAEGGALAFLPIVSGRKGRWPALVAEAAFIVTRASRDGLGAGQLRVNVGQELFPVLTLKLHVIPHDLPWIVMVLLRDSASRLPYSGNDRVVLLHSNRLQVAPAVSRVMGHIVQSKVLTRLMCPNLFALARCREFHVRRKSHLWWEASARCRASPRTSRRITLC